MQIEVGDLQFAAWRRLQALGEFDHALVVEIEADRGPVRFRRLRLLLDRHSLAVRAEFDHAVTLRIIDRIGEHGGAVAALIGAVQRLGQAVPVDDVVAEDQTTGMRRG